MFVLCSFVPVRERRMPAVDAAEKRRNVRSSRRSRDAAADPRDGVTRPPLAHRHCAFPKPVKLSQTTSVISRDFAFNRKIQAESRSRDQASVRAIRSPAVVMPQARRLCHAGAGCFKKGADTPHVALAICGPSAVNTAEIQRNAAAAADTPLWRAGVMAQKLGMICPFPVGGRGPGVAHAKHVTPWRRFAPICANIGACALESFMILGFDDSEIAC